MAASLLLGACESTSTSAAPPSSSAAAAPVGVTFEELAEYPKESRYRDGSVFPLGVWFESVRDNHDVSTDQAAGLNTYVALTRDSDLGLIEQAGMGSFGQQEEWLSEGGSQLDGWVLADELDMTMSAQDAFARLSSIDAGLPADGRDRYVNYGKGVAFWNSDDEAARFVNDYGDIVSVDTYWYTDNNICGQGEGGAMLADGTRALTDEECHRAANYGATVQRVRQLDASDGTLKPIWAFVEVGHPFSENDWPTIEPDQIRAAVWQSIIAGAQGVVYFNHSFGGTCQSQHVLREACYADQRAAVTAVNDQIDTLAPVLTSPTALGYATAPGVTTLAKQHHGSWYLFTGSDGTTGQRTFTLAPGTATQVEVIGENRTLTITNNQFTDTYPTPDTIHLYRIH